MWIGPAPATGAAAAADTAALDGGVAAHDPMADAGAHTGDSWPAQSNLEEKEKEMGKEGQRAQKKEQEGGEQSDEGEDPRWFQHLTSLRLY